MPKIVDEKTEGLFQDVIKRNPDEVDFHQAVHEVLESLGPVPAPLRVVFLSCTFDVVIRQLDPEHQRPHRKPSC